MHQSCLVFGKAHLTETDIKGAIVLEVGSRNINGSLRSYVESHKPGSYVGTDIMHGRDVDIICDAVDLVERFGTESFDVVICTSMLEHAEDWKATVSNLKHTLRPGGILLLTTSSPGYSYHNPPDYWRFTLSDMRAIFTDFDVETLKSDPQVPGVFLRARRPENFNECDLPDYQVCEVEKPTLTTIILPAHNLWHLTACCLDSIAACTYAQHEIIVVDNGSTDETSERLREMAAIQDNLRVITNEDNRSYAAVCNQGLEIANGEYILFLNNDTVVTDMWLMRMQAVFRRHPAVGIVGPMTNYAFHKTQLIEHVPYKRDVERLLPQFAADRYRQYMSLSADTTHVIGFCLLARREVFDAIDRFDEAFDYAYEEIDFCYRAREAGFQCHVAEDVFIHHVGTATFKHHRTPDDHRANIDASYRLFKKKWGAVSGEQQSKQKLPAGGAPRYLVTGTGRCGTRFMAKVFASAGIPCGHEAIFSYGGLAEASARMKGTPAEASWMAAPYLDNPLLKDTIIVHLVRHPKFVIESLLRMAIFADKVPAEYQEHADFIYRALPDLRDYEGQHNRAAAFYVQWNEMIWRLAQNRLLRCRVEDDSQELLDELEIDTEGRRLYSDVRDNAHADSMAKALVKFDLDEVNPEIQSKLLEMCDRYGYDFADPPLPPPQVYWAVLVERVIHNHAFTCLLDVAMAAGALGYLRIGTLYSRTDAVRNLIVRIFRQLSRNPKDTLVMLDCDHTHPPDIIERLVAHQEGVTAALAFRRGPNFEPMFFMRHEDGRLLKPATFERKVYKCDAVGHAAIAIKRWVFDEIQEKQGVSYFWRYTYTDTDWSSSEDMWFCKLCEDSGIKVHCDCSLETPHLRMECVDSSVWFKYRGDHPDLMTEIISESEGV